MLKSYVLIDFVPSATVPYQDRNRSYLSLQLCSEQGVPGLSGSSSNLLRFDSQMQFIEQVFVAPVRDSTLIRVTVV